MARIKMSGEKIDQISNQLSQMGTMQLAAMAGGVLTGFFVVGLLNKLLKKIGYQFGIMYYIFGGILGIVALGTLQAILPQYAHIIGYVFMGIGALGVILWIYQTFFAKSFEKNSNPTE